MTERILDVEAGLPVADSELSALALLCECDRITYNSTHDNVLMEDTNLPSLRELEADIAAFRFLNVSEYQRKLSELPILDKIEAYRRFMQAIDWLYLRQDSPSELEKRLEAHEGELIRLRQPDWWYLLVTPGHKMPEVKNRDFRKYLCCEEPLMAVGRLVVRSGDVTYDTTPAIMLLGTFGRVYTYDCETDGLSLVTTNVRQLATTGLAKCETVYRHNLTPWCCNDRLVATLLRAYQMGLDVFCRTTESNPGIIVMDTPGYRSERCVLYVSGQLDRTMTEQLPFVLMSVKDRIWLKRYLTTRLCSAAYVVGCMMSYEEPECLECHTLIVMDGGGAVFALVLHTMEVERLADDLPMFFRCGMLKQYCAIRFDRHNRNVNRLEPAGVCPHEEDFRYVKIRESFPSKKEFYMRYHMRQLFIKCPYVELGDVCVEAMEHEPPVRDLPETIPRNTVYIKEYPHRRTAGAMEPDRVPLGSRKLRVGITTMPRYLIRELYNVNVISRIRDEKDGAVPKSDLTPSSESADLPVVGTSGRPDERPMVIIRKSDDEDDSDDEVFLPESMYYGTVTLPSLPQIIDSSTSSETDSDTGVAAGPLLTNGGCVRDRASKDGNTTTGNAAADTAPCGQTAAAVSIRPDACLPSESEFAIYDILYEPNYEDEWLLPVSYDDLEARRRRLMERVMTAKAIVKVDRVPTCRNIT
uniref:Gp139 n=1 Tax=Caviid herpesvirus 2 str. CIDMTR TaxID=1415526 RepID=U6H6H5_9BETA|nr:gp139 [Caviid herpesvirus 2 str. CIDMTR]